MSEDQPQQPDQEVQKGKTQQRVKGWRKILAMVGIGAAAGVVGTAVANSSDSQPGRQGGSEPTEQVSDASTTSTTAETPTTTLPETPTQADTSTHGSEGSTGSSNSHSAPVKVGDSTAAINSDPSGAVDGAPIAVKPGTNEPIDQSPDTGFDNSHQDPEGSGTARTPDGGMATDFPNSVSGQNTTSNPAAAQSSQEFNNLPPGGGSA